MSILSLSKRLLKRDGQSAKKDADQKSSKKAVSKKSQAKKTEADAFVYSSTAHDIGLQPMFTEKGFAQQAQDTAAFQVLPHATKRSIEQAVREKYGTNVISVRTAIFAPKTRRRGVTQGQTKYWKKAYVTVEDINRITNE